MSASTSPSRPDLSEQYDHWILGHERELTASGKIKRAPPHIVARWVSSAWTSIPAELVAKSFKKCCISNTLDSTEDNLLWDEENSDVDNPSSDYIPSDSDDAGEDKDSA